MSSKRSHERGRSKPEGPIRDDATTALQSEKARNFAVVRALSIYDLEISAKLYTATRLRTDYSSRGRYPFQQNFTPTS